MVFYSGDFEATVNAGVAAELGIRLALEADGEIMAMLEIL